MPAPKGHPPYNVNGEGGRPKKYTEEFLENEAIELEKWNEIKENIFIEEFCLERNIDESRISEFVKVNERFLEAYKKTKTKQKIALFKGGLSKKLCYNMCQLLLGHTHSVYMKTEQQISGSDKNPLHFILQNDDGKSKDLVTEDGSN